jgi:hypothetical protein
MVRSSTRIKLLGEPFLFGFILPLATHKQRPKARCGELLPQPGVEVDDRRSPDVRPGTLIRQPQNRFVGSWRGEPTTSGKGDTVDRRRSVRGQHSGLTGPVRVIHGSMLPPRNRNYVVGDRTCRRSCDDRVHAISAVQANPGDVGSHRPGPRPRRRRGGCVDRSAGSPRRMRQPQARTGANNDPALLRATNAHRTGVCTRAVECAER